ncbi:MAG: extracellular solute-binding protein [Bifidobacterium breve]
MRIQLRRRHRRTEVQTWNLKNRSSPTTSRTDRQFEKENPGITIKWVDQPADNYEDKLSTDAAAGELPDVVDGP